MSLRPILKWPDARLSAVCVPVDTVTDDVRRLAADMLETMYDAPGRGLAAPQVGVLSRLFVMDATWKEGAPDPMVCINPVILGRSDETAIGAEGCLSIPGLSVDMHRPTCIRMQWTDLDGGPQDQELTGFAALCAQHELDHLNGVVTLDRVDADQRAALLAQYESAA
mmetsp:Transcript_28333/g.52867  ORF Transcript_28333/g.52867 Transcript_28333/m.52867 type:complete len:167 (+) Transcript_28333:2630-3130(+)